MIKKHKTADHTENTENTEKTSNNFFFRVFPSKGKNMHRLYENKIIMEPDQMIGDVLDLMDLVISGKALHNQETGFRAYILCSKIAKELIEIHHFKVCD